MACRKCLTPTGKFEPLSRRKTLHSNWLDTTACGARPTMSVPAIGVAAQCYSLLQQLADCGDAISPPSTSTVVGTKSFGEHAGDRKKRMFFLPSQSFPSLRRPSGQTRIHSANDAVSPLLHKLVNPPNCSYLGCHTLVPRGLRRKGSEEPARVEILPLYGVAKHRERVNDNDSSAINLPIVPQSIKLPARLNQRHLSMRPCGPVCLHHTIGR